MPVPSLMKRRPLAVGCAVFLLLPCGGLTWYVTQVLRSLLGEPNIAVDYVAKINERAAAVPEEDRALPLYLDIAHRLREIEQAELAAIADASAAWQEAYATATDPDAHAQAAPQPRNESLHLGPESDEWPAVEAYLREHADLLDTMREAAAKPAMGFVVSDSDPEGFGGNPVSLSMFSVRRRPDEPPALHGVLLPHLSLIRSMARHLAADARLAFHHGAPRVDENLRAIFSISSHAREHEIILNDLVAIAIEALACDLMLELISRNVAALEPDVLDALKDTLIDHRRASPAISAYTGEILGVYDIAQRAFTDNGRGDGILIDRQADRLARDLFGRDDPPSVLFVPFGMDRREFVETAESYYAVLGEQLAQRPWERPDLETEILRDRAEDETDPGRWLLNHILSSRSSLLKAAARRDEFLDSTIVMLAAAAARQRNGRWPSQIEGLVPDLPDGTAKDLDNGQPLIYRLDQDGRPLLYARGPDGDDDGGHRKDLASRFEQGADGDWVFFPRTEPDRD